MNIRTNTVLTLFVILGMGMLTGCGGQKAPETTAEATEQAPPPTTEPAPASETTAPPPAPQPTAQAPKGHIPEESGTKVPAVAAPQTVTLKIPAGTPLSL
ncbi:MAG TPA: hypothetical protein VJV75_04890, partial [Candidatus Polarisedimenticolia bacterium]|nr:hypothetical protein [Candidatus Polarisedimenticolia bacterium]